MEQKSLLEEMIESAGHMCIMLPKCHSMFNLIKMVRAYIKEGVGKNMTSDSTVQDIEGYVFNAMRKLCTDDQDALRRYERQSFRCVNALGVGASGKLAAFLVNMYSSHRGLPPGW